MTSECNSCKCSFDITKSKRTRRASYVTEPEHEVAAVYPLDGSEKAQNVVDETNVHGKLNQFIKVGGLEKGTNGEKDQGRALLRQHFADDEKQLQVVIRQPEQNGNVKFKRIVKRYIKTLTHLVKSKHVQRADKPVLRLTM